MAKPHNSHTCIADNGQPCSMCRFANEIEERRERDAWELEKAMSDYRLSAGSDAFMEKIESYLTANGLY